MDSYGLRYDCTFVQVSYVEGKFLKHFSYHLLVYWSPASGSAFLLPFIGMQHTSFPILPYPKRKRMRMH